MRAMQGITDWGIGHGPGIGARGAAPVGRVRHDGAGGAIEAGLGVLRGSCRVTRR